MPPALDAASPAPLAWWQLHPPLPAAYAHPSSLHGSCGRTTHTTYVISSIEFISPDGAYKLGDAIDIRVTTSHSIDDDSDPDYTRNLTRTDIELDIGPPAAPRHAVFRSVPGALDPPVTVMDYRYTVQEGDASDDLDYASARSLNWGSFVTEAHSGEYHYYNCALPAPRGEGSLSDGRAIVVDGVAPRVANVFSPTPDGTYAAGDTITVTVNFTEPVVVGTGPAPSLVLALDSGQARTRAADYVQGASTDRSLLNFTYTVRQGDGTPDLEYDSTASLTGNITDAAGNTASLALPPGYRPGSLAHSSDIAIRGEAGPRTHAHPPSMHGSCGRTTHTTYVISSIEFISPDGAYKLGDAIDIRVTTSHSVDDDSDPDYTRNLTRTDIELDIGPPAAPRHAVFRSVPGALDPPVTVMDYRYTVQEGDASDDLDYASTRSLNWGSFVTEAHSGEYHYYNCALPAPRGEGSLSDGRAIVADGVAPRVASVFSPTPAGAYAAGDTITVTVNFTEPVVVGTGPEPSLVLALDSGPTRTRAADYVQGASTDRSLLNFTYTVRQGDGASDLEYDSMISLTGNITDAAGNTASLALPPGYRPGSLAHSSDISLDTIRPNAVSVTSATPDGAYGAGRTISISVNFDEPVVYTGRDPSLALNTGGTAAYASGNGTTSLNFTYTVRPGDSAARLDYSATGALTGAIADLAGNAAVVTLRTPGSAMSLGGASAIAVDGVSPAVASVSSATPDGAYGAGAAINITVAFGERVAYTGDPPKLALNVAGDSPRTANYTSGSGTMSLDFTYTVRAGDSAARLDYSATGALTGEIADDAGNPANLTLPARPGEPGSLAHSRSIAVDTRGPSIASVTSATPDGAYGAGSTINITANFDEPVLYSGTAPTLALDVSGASRAAPYASGNGTASLNFSYTVQAGDGADDLDYYGTEALSGAITDLAGNDADLTLPEPGARGSLAHSSDIAIDTAGPRVASVTSATPDGPYAQGRQIAISVNFGEPVMYTGAAPVLTLNVSDGMRPAPYLSGNNTASLNFSYTVQAGDGADDLDYYNETALTGIITDLAGNDADLTLPEPGARGSLAHSSDIAIDTAGPRVASVTSATPDGPYGAGRAIGISVNFGEPIVYTGDDPSLALNTGGAAAYASGNGTMSLNFTYTVRAGDSAARLDYSATNALTGAIADLAGNAANLTLPARPGEPGSLAHSKSIAVDARGPSIASVTSATPDGLYGAGRTINITVTFGERVVYTGDPPRLVLNVSGAERAIPYTSGNGTASLHFSYTVQAGDGADDLDYYNETALSGAIEDYSGHAAILTLPPPGARGSLAHSSDIAIDTAGPRVASVTSATPDGPYAQGRQIAISVNFGEPVMYTGTAPTLALNVSGASRTAPYASGNGTASLNFSYTVQAGDGADDLDYYNETSLSGAITDLAGNDADLTLPEPGARGSLAHSSDIAIDTAGPRVASVTSATPDGPYAQGRQIAISVNFGEPVMYTGAAPVLTLNVSDGMRPAPYLSGNNTASLNFSYTVQAGDGADDLDYYSETSLSGAITDLAGNDADLTLPEPGARGSLAHSSDIAIDTAGPRVASVTSATPDGQYGAGRAIGISVNFDEPIVYTGDDPSLALNTGGAAAYASGNGTMSLNFTYTVRAGDSAARLDYSETNALTGAIADLAGNAANLTLPARPGEPGSLAHSRSIAVDARGPSIASVTSATPDGLYGAGSTINITVTFGERVVYTGDPPRLVLNVSGAERAIPYTSGNGTASLNFSYTVQAGDGADDLDYYNETALSGAIEDYSGHAAILTLPPPGARGSLAHSSDIAIDTAGPRVASVTSATPDGPYAQGRQIAISVNFGEPVMYTGAAPVLTLNVSGTERAAPYASGNGTASLNFSYTVQAGDGADDLDYYNETALTGAITDLAGNDADLTLPVPGGSGSLAHSSDIAIDTAGPRVASVTSATPDGPYAQGRQIAISVNFGEPVMYTGAAPVLTLNVSGTERAAPYASGNNTASLNFSYTVQAGDGADDLDYYNETALTGAITDLAGNDADLTLPVPGGSGSLAHSSDIAIDTAGPRVASVTSATPDGPYGAGRAISISVNFGEPVVYTGAAPVLTLNVSDGMRPAPYLSGNNTASLNFSYTVQAGDGADDLDYYNETALTGAITDLAGNDADLTLPEPGARGSLAHSSDIAIDTAGPRVASVTSATPDGPYGAGRAIGISVNFGEPIVYTGDDPSLALNTGGAAAYASGNGTMSLNFTYTVRPGDSAARLDYSETNALTGAIADLAGNAANLTLPARPGEPGSLAHSKSIAVDARGPSIASVTSATPDGLYGAGSTINITVTFGERVVYTGDPPRLVLNVSGAERAIPYTSGNNTASLNFSYTVQAGDGADDLDYYNETALTGAIEDYSGHAAILTLPPPGARGSLAHSSDIAIDTAGPRVASVTSATPDGPYAQGRQIAISVNFGEPVMYTGAAPTLALNVSGASRAAPYASGNGTASLNFSYTVQAGDGADDLDYYNETALTGAITDLAGNDADLTLPVPGGSGSLAHSSDIAIDTAGPRVASVTSATPDGPYGAGRAISISVNFGEPVVYTGSDPSLALNTGGTAAYASGNETMSLNFTYTVRLGDSAARLDYSETNALTGAIADLAGNAANLTLPALGSSGSLGGASAIAVDGVPPAVASVSSATPNGAYGEHAAISITVAFGERVAYTGDPPRMALNVDGVSPRTAIYASGNETMSLNFTYTVRLGDSAARLDYSETNALTGAIADLAGNAANLTLPALGSSGSLGGASAIAVDGVPPAVASVSSATPNGAYGEHAAISITVAFGERVAYTGDPPRMALNVDGVSPRTAIYASGNETMSLDFTYTVQPGDSAARLDYSATNALTGAIADLAGNAANLTLPARPGEPGSLAHSKNIAVDTAGPRVVNVTSAPPNATYIANQTIAIAVNFDEPVLYTGTIPPSLALNLGGVAAYESGNGTATLYFEYTVQPGDEEGRLDYEAAGSLAGTVTDIAGNAADLALPEPGSGGSLGGTTEIAVRGGGGTTPPPAPPPAAAAASAAANATATAVFVGTNTVRIEYSVPLNAPEGAYGTITIGDGGGTAMPVAGGVSGGGTAVHTVRFDGAGVSPDQMGTIALVMILSRTTNGTLYEFAGGTIEVRAGTDARMLTPPGLETVVAIGRDSFVREVDATGGGDSARPAINVTGLAADGDGTAVVFPGSGSTAVIASFAAVSFPAGVTATSVPADGRLDLYVSGGPPTAGQVAGALGVDASLVDVKRVVEVGDDAAHIEFDMPVRVLLDGQAGGRAFYVNNTSGEVVPIRTACAADDTAAVHAQLGGARGACWFDRDDDKIVYTYHLTRFGTAVAPTPLEVMVAGAAAGSAVRVPPGTYAEDVLVVNKSLAIEPADPGNPPLFTGYSHIVVDGQAGGPVAVRGLVFEDTAHAPGGGGLASIVVEPPARGPAAGVAPVTIEGNTFRNTCDAGVRAATPASGAAPAAAGGPPPPIAGLTVKNNRFHDIGGNSANCGAGGGAPAADPAWADAIVAGQYNAAAAPAGAGGASSPAQLTGMAVLDNYIFGTTYTGIRIAGADGLAVTGNHIEGVPDDGMRIMQSRNVQVHLNTIVGANQAPRLAASAAAAAAAPHDGSAGAAIEVWSGSDDVAVTLNRISESAGALLVCAGTCDPGPDAANGTGGGPVPVAAVPVNAAGGAGDIRFSHNVLAASNTGTLIANSAGGELDARANYWPGHAESAAGRVSPAGAVLLEPALDGAGPVRIGAVVADGPSSAVRSVDSAVRAAFVLGVHDFNAGQARAGGAVGLEPAVRTAGSPNYTAAARAGHASDVAALRSGASADARMLPVLHNSISSAMALYDASGDAALAAIGAMGAAHAHYPFVLDRSGAIAAHGADASLAGGRSDGGDGVGTAAAPELLDFAADAAAAAGGTGVDPGHPNAPWKWRAHESVNPATNTAEPKRSVLALHPGPDGAAHTEDDLVFGAGYHQGPGAAHLVVAAGDAAAAAASAAAGSGAAVAVSPASTASQLAARDALFRLAPPDALLAGVVMAQALADRSNAAAPLTIVALNDSASLQSMSLAGELYEIDLQGALPDGVDRIAAVSYNSSSPPPPADGGGGAAAGGGWAADAAGRIREAASAPQGGPAAVVYSGRAGAFAELADALGGQPPPNSRWYSTGDLARAELASSGPDAVSLARAGQLAAVLQHAVPNAEIDAALAAPGIGIVLDESTRGPAYAAYDAPALLGRAMASTPGVPGAPASIARAIDEDVARTHAGALGSPLILDRNGDLVLPIAYDVSAFPAAAGGDPAGAWGQLDTRIGERSCGIALAKGALDFGILSLGRHSRPDTQTVINTGTLPYRSVTLDPGDWTYASGQTLPASITELRELGRAAAYAGAASGFVVAPGLEPGQDSNVQFRINLTAYQSLPPGEASQTINYLVECRAAAR